MQSAGLSEQEELAPDPCSECVALDAKLPLEGNGDDLNSRLVEKAQRGTGWEIQDARKCLCSQMASVVRRAVT